MKRHPLEALTPEEVTAAVATIRGTGRLTDAARFASVTVAEPTKAELAAHEAGDPCPRRVRATIVPGPRCRLVEAVVDLAADVSAGDGAGDPVALVSAWVELDDVRPALLFEEAFIAMAALVENDEWLAALARRGITDPSKVQIDPWPTGNFGVPVEEGRRVARCIPYYREEPTDNGYARPVEGLLARVDMATGEVLEVTDAGVVPLAPERGSYYPEDSGPLRDDLRPLEITQPEGTSFTLEGNQLCWQRWSLRITMDPLEGLVLHTVGYEDGGRVRPILHRASISEMVVPYGDPSPLHGWKNAFDVGEWGLGRMANSLTLGCDCLGVIHYVDAVTADEHGNPVTVPNVICIHEEDYGILWKHRDLHGGRTEVRRSRRLVISSISTVGNYEYGFYWYLYLDGSMQLEVKLTGIMSTRAMPDGERSPHAPPIAPGLAAPVHQHLFCARLDLDVDGPGNEVHEVDVLPDPPGDDNPWANAFRPHVTRLGTEQAARRKVDAARSRVWKIVNPAVRNRLGEPVGYKLLPGATPTMLAGPGSSVARRAAFATENLWVTPYTPEERRPAGDHPNQHPGGDGLPAWTAADRSLVDADVVLWHTFGVTHVPRPEDWPVMPVEYCGFHLVPVGFFDRNPALDVPPPGGGHCEG